MCLVAAVASCSALYVPVAAAGQSAVPIGKNHARVKRQFAPLIARAAQSTMRVFAAGRRQDVGLATVLTESGYLVTHGGLPSGRLIGQLPGGRRTPLQRVARLDRHGIAILRARSGTLRPMVWRRGPAPATGSLLFCAGRGSDPVAVGIAGPRRAVPDNTIRWLEHDLVLRPNDCGGPLVDTRGRAVGISVQNAHRAPRHALPAEAMLTAIGSLVESLPHLKALAAGLRKIEARTDRPNADPPKAVRQLQARIRDAARKAAKVTVRIRLGAVRGSGVLISANGFVLTAAHVSRDSGQLAQLRLPDGRRVTAESRGADHQADLGLLKIRDPGPWPHISRGALSPPAPGPWCLAAGHPADRVQRGPPALRLGKILRSGTQQLITDCTLAPGDSGGPLFDLQGTLLAIHSQSGNNLSHNTHVPVALLPARWRRLVKDRVWGHKPAARPTSTAPGYLGVTGDGRTTEPRIRQVHPHSPAQRAGLRAGDVVRRVGDQPIDSFARLSRTIRRLTPGSIISIDVIRHQRVVTVMVTVGTAPAE